VLAPTPFTELVGCRLPLQQAGMGGVTTPELAGAVARAGGLGMIAVAGLTASDAADHVTVALQVAGADGRIGANFLIPFLDLSALEDVARRLPVVELFYGDPDGAVVERIHDGGALAAWQVGSEDEARAAVDAGCDLVVAQGCEAGGHLRGDRPLLPLLADVRAAVDVPLVAAGGIGSGAAMAAALSAGADAVRIGTRFLATEEADVHPEYVEALLRSGPDDTTVTQAFSLGWPDAPHRVITSCLEASNDDPSTRSPLPPTRDFDGDAAAAALYAGESVGDVRQVLPAHEVVDELVREAEAALP